MSFDPNAAKAEQLAILKAMGTIMDHVSDEDVLERWLPWGIEPGMEPEDLEVLLPDFPAIVNHFARLVRAATRKDTGGIDGWLFVEGPEGRNLAHSANGRGGTPPDADQPESAGN